MNKIKNGNFYDEKITINLDFTKSTQYENIYEQSTLFILILFSAIYKNIRNLLSRIKNSVKKNYTAVFRTGSKKSMCFSF